MSRYCLLISCMIIVLLFSLSGCSWKNHITQNDEKLANQPPVHANKTHVSSENVKNETRNDTSIQVVSNPEVIPVLVNKRNKLPDDYRPHDLVDPDIPFIFKEKTQKRKMRIAAAKAIEKMFAGAEQDGVSLLGVSAYRSHVAQTALFNYYVNADGYKLASTYSAIPGTSEHETGLAIDVTGGNGKCAAEHCFEGTVEAKWLHQHAAEYGFIIRYPKGKDKITGYKYEPWHLRYVGKTIAKEIMNRGITLEEYLETVQVNK
jgi:D-alanyl-D-alanine carboxypeptidase